MRSLKSPLSSLLLSALVLTLAACGPKPEEAEDVEEMMAPTMADVSALPAPVYGAPKKYAPISKTAEAITDSFEIANGERGGENAPPRVKITLGFGHTYDADWIDTNKASADIAGQAWTAVLPVPAEAEVSVYAVAEELVNAKAPNGGLCKPDRTGFIALATYKNSLGEDELQMAAFKGEQWPPQNTDGLCGTFTYIAEK